MNKIYNREQLFNHEILRLGGDQLRLDNYNGYVDYIDDIVMRYLIHNETGY
jgi:hypothetical protein